MVRGHSPSWLGAGNAQTPSRVRARLRPCVEWLEERCVPAQLIVTNANDDGAGSLRAALAAAEVLEGKDDIVFAPSMQGQTIQLTSELAVNSVVSIGGIDEFGTFVDGITIRGGPSSRVFTINSEISVDIFRLTIAGGTADQGGAIWNGGSLSLSEVTFVSNTATEAGGAIFNQGFLTVNFCDFVSNSAAQGGALFNVGTMNCTGNAFTNNSALEGAAVYNTSDGSGSLYGTSLIGNSDFAIVNDAPYFSFSVYDVLTFDLPVLTATVQEEESTYVLARFTASDPGEFSVFISWGDGREGTPGTIVPVGEIFEVRGNHAYTRDTTFPIQISISKGESFFRVSTTIAVLTEDQANALTDFELVTALPGDEVLIANSSGVTAALVLGDTNADPPATLFVGTFSGNPEDAASTGLVFYDVRVTNVPPGSVLTVTFAYPGFAGDQVIVQYFDVVSQTYQQVQAATFIDAVADTVTIVLTDTTIPSLAMLSHTVFTIALAPPPPTPAAATATTTINPFIVSATNGVSGQVSAPISTSFSSSAPVTLTLTPLQQSTLRGSQSAVGGSEAAAEGRGAFGIVSGGSDEVPFKWVWNLLRLDDFLQWLQPPTGRMEEAQPPMDEPLMETWLEMPLFFPGQGLSAPAAPAASADATPLLPAPQVDELLAQDAQRLACIGLAFAGAVGLCAEKRRRARR